jgi:hypothetical protein
MLDSSRLLPLARHLPALFHGAGLHHAALAEMASGRHDLAEALFERAAARYRAEVQVEAIARLRVHQLMNRIRSGALLDREDEAALEVERRLCCLRRIEALEHPFPLVEARELLGTWLARPLNSEVEVLRRAA